jgi:hypothetical protein
MFFGSNMRIKTEFVFHKKKNENTDGNPDSKTDDGDERKGLMFSDIPQSDLYMVFKHYPISKNLSNPTVPYFLDLQKICQQDLLMVFLKSSNPYVH